jgi:hypothetical protein
MLIFLSCVPPATVAATVQKDDLVMRSMGQSLFFGIMPADIQDLNRGLSIAESSALAQFRSGHTALNWSPSRFRQTPLPNCACGVTETTFHFIVQWPKYDDLRFTLKADLPQAGADNSECRIGS